MKSITQLLHINGIRKKTNLFLVNRLLKGTNPKLFEVKRSLLNSAGYSIGRGTKVVGPLFVQGKLIVGQDCWIGKNFTVNGNGSVAIGDRCDIAPDVKFQTGGHVVGDKNRRAGEGVVFDISVGSGCWICAGADILGGVSIGESCVVAARACVAKDMPDNVLCGGVPAKLIRKLD